MQIRKVLKRFEHGGAGRPLWGKAQKLPIQPYLSKAATAGLQYKNRELILKLEKAIMTKYSPDHYYRREATGGDHQPPHRRRSRPNHDPAAPLPRARQHPLLRLCQPTYFFKDTESYVRTIDEFLPEHLGIALCRLTCGSLLRSSL